MQYGIGTYIRELKDALLKMEAIKIILVSYHNIGVKEFSVTTISDNYLEINIPSPVINTSQNNSFDKKYASAVVRLLTDFIPKNSNVIFQINYLDDLPIANRLKDKYNYCIVSIVHFAQWQQLFNGNRNKLRGLNIDQPTNNVEFTLSKEKEFYQITDHTVSVTRYMKDFIINDYGINPDKISVIPNGLGYTRFDLISDGERDILKRRLGFGMDDLVIMFSGRIDPCKGVLYLLEAFEEACKHKLNLKLVMLGQGKIQECQKRIQSSFGRVIYTGFLPKELVTSFYQVADIGIVPSIYDHCPYTVLEMVANKIPLIASRINGLDEILDDTQCLFVNPVTSSTGDISFNIQDLSEAILKMAGDSNLRYELALNSYDNLIKKFTANRMAYEMNNLFQTLKTDT